MLEIAEMRQDRPAAISMKDASRSVSVGITGLYGEVNSGRLKTLKRGSRTLIMLADLEEWAERLPDDQAQRARNK